MLPIFSFCQSKIKIISGEEKFALPYASIINKTSNHFFSANEYGEALLYGNFGDSILISYAGYKDVSFVNKKEEKIVELFLLHKFLPEVFVFKCKKGNTFLLENGLKPGKLFNGFVGINWTYSEITKPYALLIKDLPSNSKIETFSFWLEKSLQSPDSTILAPFIVMIYSFDSLSQIPGNPLLSKPLIFFPKKQGKQTINLDSLNLYSPKNGIFISIQYVIDKKFSWNQKVLTDRGADTTIISYGGIIKGGINKSQNESFIYDVQNNKWIKFKNRIIAFEIKYRKCN